MKRLHSSRVSPNGILNLNVGPFRSEDVNLSRELREHERQERARLEHDPLDRKLDREQQHYPSYNSKCTRENKSSFPLHLSITFYVHLCSLNVDKKGISKYSRGCCMITNGTTIYQRR